MKENANESAIAALTRAVNEKKHLSTSGKKALIDIQTQNNKSKKSKITHTEGKRRNVYFSARSLNDLGKVEDVDGVTMSSAIQAALYLLAITTEVEREKIYKELKIKSNSDK
ncbi:hypothetical protein Sbal223_4463 (plasmid) [Shewanella baltica OS223]|nr:hypothetical protein Sbal223_4463 [Shewanella baltica OS223]